MRQLQKQMYLSAYISILLQSHLQMVQKYIIQIPITDLTLNSMIGTSYPDGSAADYYGVIRGAKRAGFPGIIVEHAFISNASDAKTYLNSSTKLKRLGVADAKGIAACYGLKKSDDTVSSLKPTNFTKLVGNTSESVSLKWTKVKNAGGYEIYRSTSKKGKLLGKPVVKVKKQSSRADIIWKTVEGANGYEIYRSTTKNGKFQKLAFVENITSYKDVSGTGNDFYYYKIRAVGGGIKGSTYSSYSTVK